MTKRADLANHGAASNASRPPFAELGPGSRHEAATWSNVRRKLDAHHATSHEDPVLMFERALTEVGLQCDVLRRAMRSQDLGAVERAGYALASAWFFAEGRSLRILSTKAGSAARAQFARKALFATNSVITACFGEVLAETSSWSCFQPTLPVLRRLRAILRQLSIRVDVRDRAGRL